MPAARKLLPTVIRLAIVLVPLLVASVFWASYRNRASPADPAKAVTAARSSTSSSMSQETAHTDPSGSEGLGNAQSAIAFSLAPRTSLSAMTPPVDPDPAAGARCRGGHSLGDAEATRPYYPRSRLAGSDGSSIIERLRSWSTTPIIVLTVRSNEREKVRLLELGAVRYRRVDCAGARDVAAPRCHHIGERPRRQRRPA
jgi:hypothetical protein